MIFKKLVLMVLMLCAILAQSSCGFAPQETRLLFRVEERNFSEDIITEYRVFENGLVNTTITHNSSNKDESDKSYLYASSFKKLSAAELKEARAYSQELKVLEHHNYFPWKEDFYQRGDVIKIEFVDDFSPIAVDDSELDPVAMPKTFIFYTGLDDNPELLDSILNLLT